MGPPPRAAGVAGTDVTVGTVLAWVAAYLGFAAVVGVVSAFLWSGVVPLASYTVNQDGGAETTERGLALYFAGDAWFCLIGLVVGVGLGLVGWRWFGLLGWPMVLLVALGGLTAAFVCAGLGHQLGPGDFADRLAAAAPGDRVPIELEVRAKASLVVWLFAAVAPVLVRSSLGRDPEDD